MDVICQCCAPEIDFKGFIFGVVVFFFLRDDVGEAKEPVIKEIVLLAHGA